MEEIISGKLITLGLFFRKAKEMVIGGKVTQGKITNGGEFRVIRE